MQVLDQLGLSLDMKDIEDPLPRMVGCSDETKLYPGDRVVLTYPVKCR
jgi:hypothetical protein